MTSSTRASADRILHKRIQLVIWTGLLGVILTLQIGCGHTQTALDAPGTRSTPESHAMDLGIQFEQVTTRSQALTQRSQVEEIEEALKELIAVQGRFDELKSDNEFVEMRIEFMNTEVQRLTKAKRVATLQAELCALDSSSDPSPEPGRSERRAVLRESDERYRALDNELVRAEREYVGLANNAKKLAARLKNPVPELNSPG